MAYLNDSKIMGHLTRKPEVRQSGGYKVARFTVAVSRGKDEKKKTYFIPCEAWNMQADFAEESEQGALVLVCGELVVEKYQDKEGIEKTATKIVCSNYGGFNFLRNALNKGSDDDNRKPKQETNKAKPQDNGGDDDLPF